MSTSVEPLAPGTRLIHIGPQKTGTTSIQIALFEVREELPQHGAYYPKGAHRRRRAAYSLGLPDNRTGWPMEPWERLVKEVAAQGDARVVISNEDFSRADDPAVIDRIVRELGGGHPVHVLAVARRMDRYLPSQWQQRVKSRILLGWDDWLRAALGDDPTNREHRNVWLGHDVAALTRRWLEHVEPDQFTLVCGDEQDRTQQERLFERLLDLPEGLVRSNPARANRSLTLAEVELLRSLGELWLREGWSHQDYNELVVRGFVRRLIREEPTGSGPRSAVLPDWAYDRVRALSDRRVEEVAALPVRIIGDPEQLRVPAREPLGDTGSVGELALPVDRLAYALEKIFEAAVRGNQADAVD